MGFYQTASSGPCVAFIAAVVGVEMNFKDIKVMKGDQLDAEYVKVEAIKIPVVMAEPRITASRLTG